MANSFDAYHKWLGIPPKDQPPNHYRLLAVELFESDPDVIDSAANRVMAYLHSFAAGPNIALSQKLLNEVAAARVCLLQAASKAEYDRELRAKLAANKPAPVVTSPSPLPNAVHTFSRVPSATAQVADVSSVAPVPSSKSSPGIVVPLTSDPVAPVNKYLPSSAQTKTGSRVAIRRMRSKRRSRKRAWTFSVASLMPLAILAAAVAWFWPEIERRISWYPERDEVADAESSIAVASAQPKSDAARLPRQPAPAIPIAAKASSPPAAPRSASPAVVPFSPQRAKEHQRAWAQQLKVPERLTNAWGMQLVLIPPGEFMMGSTDAEVADCLKDPEVPSSLVANEAYEAETPRHRVKISQPFYAGVHKVTIGQFRQFVAEANYKTQAELDGKGGWGHRAPGHESVSRDPRFIWSHPGDIPFEDASAVTEVTWSDAVEFCNFLSAKEGLQPGYEKLDPNDWRPVSGNGYRLPSEAQWEYCCRAGSAGKYCFGDDDHLLALYAPERDHPVLGQKDPNAFGLMDVHGGQREWCQDWYDATYYAHSPVVDPPGPDTGTLRVWRGRWGGQSVNRRSAFRYYAGPNVSSWDIGFRVVRGAARVPAQAGNRTSPSASPAVDVPPSTDLVGGAGMLPPGAAEAEPSAQSDRLAATAVLRLGGIVVESVDNGPAYEVKLLEYLPSKDFALSQINLAGNKELRDGDLLPLTSLRSLTAMYLNQTNISDTGLRVLLECPHLQTLYLGSTSITAAAMPLIGRCAELQVLNLDKTDISDESLQELRGLKNLSVLALNRTRISDAGLAHLQSLTGLSQLSLSETLVKGDGFVHLQGLSALHYLGLSRSKVSDAGLSALERLTALTTLDLAGTRVTDKGVAKLKSLANLESLVLIDTDVTDRGVRQLHRSLPKCKIDR